MVKIKIFFFEAKVDVFLSSLSGYVVFFMEILRNYSS